ncbi:MAG TPA: NDP-sugar synthase [Candidatus Thermoplasmatota archaeon]|nr:NDP-sugar synthase [Candidatus Thermoplasmatota archaeon]
MKAVILAGGEGTRLRPITEGVPKPLVRVAGRPVVEYTIEGLVEAGIRDIFLTTFYKPDHLIGALSGGSRLGGRLFYSVEDEALGTAGSVRKLATLIKNDVFVVASGDVLADVDFRALLEFHKGTGAEATMALTRVENPTEFGIVGLDEQGRITRFLEKPKPEQVFSNLVNAGIYVLNGSLLNLIPEGEKYDFSRQLFPRMLEEGRGLYGCPLDGLWMDVGRPADLLAATQAVAERRFGGSYREGARTLPGARTERTALYPGAEVGKEAVVEDAILYENARVGEGAVVRRSILCPGAVVEPFAHLEDCVLGPRATVRAKVRAAGVRLSPGETLTG